MSVYTMYDEKRDKLKETLTECLEMARELLDENIPGYNEMREDYAFDVYVAIKKAKDVL